MLLSEQVENALKKEITSGRMHPGQQVSASYLGSDWKISSTSFRNAVRALERQGFVTVAPRKGIYVAAMDAEAIIEVFDLRIALECMAVERATPLVPPDEASRVLKTYMKARACNAGKVRLEKADRLVHDLAYVHCGNRRLQKALASHKELIQWAQSTIIREQPDAYRIALPEHIQIMNAICAREDEAASSAMRTHLECSRARFCAQFDKFNPR
jgi:DNA-binding GntR family transcriptional regulator